jgi:DNA-binding SARP family transcriptional activator/DNA-binding NarL/FixJ family response regulator
MFLLVDENDWVTPLLERGLSEESQVLQVSHGERALELREKGNISMVFVAQYLPDMDGLDLLNILRSNFPSTPLVFVAEDSAKETIISAFRNGALDYLEKPVDEHSFAGTLHRTTHFDPKTRIKNPVSGAKRNGNRFKNFFSNFFNIRKKPKNYRSASSCKVEEARILDLQNQNLKLKKIADHKDKVRTDAGAQTPLEVFFLGKFRVIFDGQPIERWPNRKGRAIFSYLAYNHKKRVYRDILMDTFWPKSSPDSARNSLNVAIHSIRHIFQNIDPDREIIIYNDECYFLNPEIGLTLDVEEFLNSWRRARNIANSRGLEAAIGEFELAAAIYKGDFMEEDLYDNWMIVERDNLMEIYLEILDKISRLYSLNGKPEIAIDLGELILEKDNCRENVHRRIMQCYYRIGKRDKALKQYHKCVKILKSELEVEPTNETRRLYAKLKEDSLT